MNPLVLASLIGGGTSVASGILGFLTNKKSNSTNLAIARETNQANADMMREQNAFNKQMSEYQNQWNSASAQRERLMAAGYNPASLIGNQQAPAVSVSGANVPQLQRAEMRPFEPSPYLAILGQNVAAFAAAQKDIAAAKGQEIDNQTKSTMNKATIDSLVARGLLDEQQAANYKQEYDLKETNWNSLEQQIQQSAYETFERARNLKIENDLRDQFGKLYEDAKVKELVNRAWMYVEEGNLARANAVLASVRAKTEPMEVAIKRAEMLTNRMVGESIAALNLSRTEMQNLENGVYREFGRSKVAAELLDAIYAKDAKRMANWLTENSSKASLFGKIFRETVGAVIHSFSPFMFAPE